MKVQVFIDCNESNENNYTDFHFQQKKPPILNSNDLKWGAFRFVSMIEIYRLNFKNIELI